MEPEGSLPHSQVPATCPYPEPDRSIPYPQIPLPEDPSYYYPPIYAWVSQVVSFLQVSLPKPCIRLSSPSICATCPVHLILLAFITRTILGEEYRPLSSSLSSFLHSPVTLSLLGPQIPLPEDPSYYYPHFLCFHYVNFFKTVFVLRVLF